MCCGRVSDRKSIALTDPRQIAEALPLVEEASRSGAGPCACKRPPQPSSDSERSGVCAKFSRPLRDSCPKECGIHSSSRH